MNCSVWGVLISAGSCFGLQMLIKRAKLYTEVVTFSLRVLLFHHNDLFVFIKHMPF